ncbi:hypothetical protein EV702DRAFT_1280397 [Suillus placidus]|uniref:Uncharacterized protein n=1 Tax=Suillus placidus TaxID=48579 RepID=A0A9P7D155_9AGAM|nr:hypothetical protein EV702DRAFT_1280397 [Suillus placidus]
MPAITGLLAWALILVWCIIIASISMTMYITLKAYTSVTRLLILLGMAVMWCLAFMISVTPTTQETTQERPPGPVHILSFIFELFLVSFLFIIKGSAPFDLQVLDTLSDPVKLRLQSLALQFS